jgi:ABC-type Na+ efflux pump permease subunit
MVLAGSLLTIAATSLLFHSEMENRTALTLLAKPVGRAEFLLGKLLGVLALVALFSAAMTALIIALLWSRESSLLHARPELFGPAHGLRYADVIAVGLVHGMGFAVLAALTLAVASYARTGLFTVMMSLGALVICHLQHVAQEAYERAGTPILRGVMGCIALIFPDFQVFDLGDLLESDGGIEVALLARVSAYALSYIVMLGALAVFLFRRREI